MSMGSFGLMAAPTRPKKEVSVGRSKTKGGEVQVYARSFLLEFRERFVQLPPELTNSNVEIVLNDQQPQPSAEPNWGQHEVAGPSGDRGGRGGGGGGGRGGGGGGNPEGTGDKRDWRTRTELPAPRENQHGGGGRDNQGGRGGGGGGGHRGGGGGGGGGHHGRQSAPMPAGPDIAIQKTDNAWQIGQTKDEKEKLMRIIKVILNKITPEKFEKLSDQIVEAGIASADILRGVISLIFGKAVSEPTFCQLYARLCLKLSKALPEFPPSEGEDKPMTFRRVLLNTCQEEFEGAAAQRAQILEEIAAIPGCTNETKDYMLRKVKLATLGNIRLIGELFKEKMILEKILHACILDLLGKPKEVPPEENMEALCNLLTTVGKNLDSMPRSKSLMESYFVRLNAFTKNDKQVSPRIRFTCKDVIDLRRNKWIPRREKLVAKTIDEVHAEAAAEMGLSRPMPRQGGQTAGGGAGQPGGGGQGAGGGGGGHEEERAMFPEGPNRQPEQATDDGWEVAGRKKKQAEAQASGATYSALTGPYVPTNFSVRAPPPSAAPPAKEVVQVAVPTPAAAAPAVPAAPTKKLTSEELEKKLTNLLEEFLSVRDSKELFLSLEEFAGQVEDKAAMHLKLLQMGVQMIMDKGVEKIGASISEVLVEMVKKGLASWEDLTKPIIPLMAQMEDLMMDVPMAPKLMANLIASVITESSGALTLELVTTLCMPIEDIFSRRDVAVPVFKALKSKGPLMKMVMDSKYDVKPLLLDEGGPVELKEFLEKQDLKVLWVE